MIVQALPASGKSMLAKRSSRFFDTDVFIDRLGFKGKFGELLEDERARDSFLHSCREADKSGILLTNLDLSKFGVRVDKRYGYKPDVYVDHIVQSGRTDLEEQFNRATLTQWAKDYEKLSDVTWLDAGEYLSDTDLAS